MRVIGAMIFVAITRCKALLDLVEACERRDIPPMAKQNLGQMELGQTETSIQLNFANFKSKLHGEAGSHHPTKTEMQPSFVFVKTARFPACRRPKKHLWSKESNRLKQWRKPSLRSKWTRAQLQRRAKRSFLTCFFHTPN